MFVAINETSTRGLPGAQMRRDSFGAGEVHVNGAGGLSTLFLAELSAKLNQS